MNDAVIDRNSSDHGRAFAGQFLAERLSIAVRGKIHDGLGAHIYRCHYFFHFNIIIFAIPGNAEIHIDLCTEHGANAIGVDTGMPFVGADGHLSSGHQISDFFFCAVFFCSNDFHFRGDDSLFCCVHLGSICFHPFVSFLKESCVA